jgi:hypothetical protein
VAVLLCASMAAASSPASASGAANDGSAPEEWTPQLPIDDPLDESPWLDDPPPLDFDDPPPLDPPVDAPVTSGREADEARIRLELARARARAELDELDELAGFDDPDAPEIDPARRRVHLGIDVSRNRSVDLVELDASGEETHAVVCESPCDRVVAIDPTRLYRVTGELRPSKPFLIPPQNRVELRVRGGSYGLLLGGIMVGALGMSIAIGSVPVFAAAKQADEDPDMSGTGRRRVARILLGTGLAALVIGTIMGFGSRTRVRAR